MMWKCFNLANNQIFPLISLLFNCIFEASTCGTNPVGHLWWLCDNKMQKKKNAATVHKTIFSFLKGRDKSCAMFPILKYCCVDLIFVLIEPTDTGNG